MTAAFTIQPTDRQLYHWVSKGYLHPLNTANGQRARYDWSSGERRVAGTMARLVQAGLTVDAAHRVARGHGELAPGVVVTVDGAGTAGVAA